MEDFSKIESLVKEAAVEHAKFTDKKNKAAGTRLRKKLAEISSLCKSLRKEITEIKASM